MRSQSTGHRNACADRELACPQALWPSAGVQFLQRVGGQPFEVQRVPLEVLRARHAASTDSMQKTFAALMIGYAIGKVIEPSCAQTSSGGTLRSVQEYARQVVGSV